MKLNVIKIFLFAKKNKRSAALIIFLFTLAFFSAAEREIESQSGYFKIIFPENSEQPANAVLNAADKAKEIVETNLGSKISEKITILYAATQKDFLSLSGNRNEHILAYASADKRQILINGEALKRQGIEGLYKTLIHEYAHIYIGITIPSEIPRWLNEGLVMHLAGEWSWFRSFSLLKAHAFNNLIPLRELDMSFPSNPQMLSLAYDQSYSITEFLIKKKYSSKNDAALFIEALADSKRGANIIETLWDPFIRDGIESGWKNYLGKRIWSWVFIFSSGSIFWFAVAVLFIAAYMKKKTSRGKKLKEWEMEEAVYSSLSKEDEKEFWTPVEEDDDNKWRGDEHQEEDFEEENDEGYFDKKEKF